MKRAFGTLANFFFPGLGYLLFGPKRVQGLVWFLAMVGLTKVELSLQALDTTLYWTMFASVFAFNTAFAVDSFFEFTKAHAANDASRGESR